MYKLVKDIWSGNVVSVTKINSDGPGISIPLVESNTDYQAYLAWVAEGNEPLPADE